MKPPSWRQIGRVALAGIGLAVCCGVLFFLATGYDEVLTDAEVLPLALGLAGLMLSLGIGALWFAATQRRTSSRILDAAVYLSALAIIVGAATLA